MKRVKAARSTSSYPYRAVFNKNGAIAECFDVFVFSFFLDIIKIKNCRFDFIKEGGGEKKRKKKLVVLEITNGQPGKYDNNNCARSFNARSFTLHYFIFDLDYKMLYCQTVDKS